jgi:hypothetical protein
MTAVPDDAVPDYVADHSALTAGLFAGTPYQRHHKISLDIAEL